jgi:hypothetical protein
MTGRQRADHLGDDDLVLAYYRELPAAEQAQADAHLAACEACRDARTRLVQTLGLVDAAPPVDAPEGFERVMWARVQAALPPPRRGWRAALGLPQWVVPLAAAAVLVMAAFVAGRWSTDPGTPPAAATTAAVADSAADVPERILLVAAGEHLDRTQMVLAELVNADPARGRILDVERERAADLVSANRVIRQSAAAAGDDTLERLLEDLERVLLEVANGGGADAAAELEMVKARIESRGILFRLRVVSSDVRQREAQPRRLAAPVS